MTIDMISLRAAGTCGICKVEIGDPPHTVLYDDEGLACHHVFHPECGKGLSQAGSCPSCGNAYTDKADWDGDAG